MSVSTVIVTWSVEDLALAGTSGSITFQLSQVVVDTSTGNVISPSPPRTYSFAGVPGQSDALVANDSASLQPQGTYYTVTIAGSTASYSFNVAINHADGATQALGTLIENQVQPVTQYAQYMQLPTGTPAPGDVPTIVSGTQTTWAPSGTGGSGFPGSPAVSGTPAAGQVLTATSATAATWQTPAGGGAVSSVFGRTGAVVAANGDYTAAQVGALATANNLSELSSTAATARSNLGLGTAATAAATAFDAAGAAAAAQSAAEAASLPLPAGTATAGYVPVATGSGNATTWQAQSGTGGGNIDGGSATTGMTPAGNINGGNA